LISKIGVYMDSKGAVPPLAGRAGVAKFFSRKIFVTKSSRFRYGQSFLAQRRNREERIFLFKRVANLRSSRKKQQICFIYDLF
jgi:hypothetical protein